MEQIPEISVIVPVYKVEPYLDRCVQSILRQTFRAFELILVDDGSPDGCPAMCDAWAKQDRRIRVLHKENGGLSSARNAGLAVATGRYISFVDSDDWIEPQMLEYLWNLLQAHPEAQIAQCEAIISKDQTPAQAQPQEEIAVFDQTGMLDYFFRIHGEASNTAVWNKLYARDILQGFSFVPTLNEDVEASYEFFQRASHMVVSNQKLYHYFVNNTGITRSKFSKKDLDYLAVWDRIVERTRVEHPEYLHYAVISRKRANFTMLCKMLSRGFSRDDRQMVAVHRSLKAQVRKDFRLLMGWRMPISRKILLILVCL